VRRSYEGISAFSTEAAARAMAVRRPYLGAYLAALDIPEGAEIEYAQMGKKPEHYDLYGPPEVLMRCVRAVISV
jgi:hypothetical protein